MKEMVLSKAPCLDSLMEIGSAKTREKEDISG